MEGLQDIVRVLARPIEFASHSDSAHLSTVKSLGPFVTRQVLQALARRVYLPQVETELLTLRSLFSDYHEGLSEHERKRRLAEAQKILERLSRYPGDMTKEARTRESPAKEKVQRSNRTDVGKTSHDPGSSPRSPHLEFQGGDLWRLPIRFARGVGPKRAVLCHKVGVRTVEDALWYLPWRYEDRSVVTPIADLRPGARGTICGRVLSARLTRASRRGMMILNITVEDDSGTIACVYFNQPYLEQTLKPGLRVMMNGMVSVGRRGWNNLQLEAPHHEILGEEEDIPLHVGRIVPIYHETKGLTSRQIRTITRGLLDEYVRGLQELVPVEILARQGLPSLAEALADAHFPGPSADLFSLDRGRTRAHQRLAFEEFFLLELGLGLRKRSVQEEVKGIRFNVKTALLAGLRDGLPFQLTEAQERVVSEILRDMGGEHPMNRLLQGDVGCGKTIVAMHAIVVATGSGYQAALMVPTEILAEQHFLTVRNVLTSLGLNVVLLESGGRQKARLSVIRQIEEGEVDLVIGTHALIQKDVRFKRLGLAVIDEQHKFGVLQRKNLLEKGYHPDVLVLTATPIPRTLAMTVYGDLNVSVIDALPPGRKPVRTLVFAESQRRRAYRLLKDEIDSGRQAYIVYPLVEESEKTDLKAALQGAEQLQAEEFRDVRVGVLHGRMKTEEKAATMAAFKAGHIKILVATTVVEVGVDVPNATAMLVEHADRFGLAQLHQLRGRVGRGGQQSYCLLMSSRKGLWREGAPKTGEADPRWRRPMGETLVTQARQRLEALVKSSDGFVIAEEDLRIRGPGEFFGVRQWGPPEFRVANLIRDGAILEQARQEAFALLAADPRLADPVRRALREATLRRWQTKLDLGSVS